MVPNGSKRFRSKFCCCSCILWFDALFRFCCWRCFLARSVAGLTLLFAVSFQIVGTDIKCFSWWSDSGIRNPSSLLVPTSLQVDWFRSEVRAGSFRPSPTTYPENGTNPSADLVEAVSLVICEEITWRPIFFGRWFRSIVDRVSVVFTSNNNQVLASNTRQFLPVTV